MSQATELRKQQYERFQELFALGDNATWTMAAILDIPVVVFTGTTT